MRINIYHEELTDEVTLVEKDVDDKAFGPRTFYGVRVYLKSPEELHHEPDDDDRSAITFWFREGDQAKFVHDIFKNMDETMEVNFA